MARRGRPAQGPALVEALDGSALAKTRLSIIIETLSGRTTVQDACSRLGIGRTAFNKMRSRFLAEATDLLEPRQAGRKPRSVTPEQVQLAELERQNQQLKLDLAAQQVREEIAVVMPFLLKRAKTRSQKTTPPRPPQPPQPPRTGRARASTTGPARSPRTRGGSGSTGR